MAALGFVKRGRFWLCLAATLYAFGFGLAVKETGWQGIRWTRFSVLLPTILLLASMTNRWFRSRALGWGILISSFLSLLMIVSALIAQLQASSVIPWSPFLRGSAMYAAFLMIGLMQVRPNPYKS